MARPELILHVLAPSHPCMTAEAALRRKSLAYKRVALIPGEHVAELQRIYGEGRGTVPGLPAREPPAGRESTVTRAPVLRRSGSYRPTDSRVSPPHPAPVACLALGGVGRWSGGNR